MPDESIEPREHYVYALYREDGVTPFYIGMGVRDRWLQHERNAHRRRNHKNSIILQFMRCGVPVPKIKLARHLTKNEAISMEMVFIEYFGRAPNGPLVNATQGGEGILGLSAEQLAQRAANVAAAQRRPETKAKRSATQKGKKMPPRTAECRERARAASLGNTNFQKMSPKMQASTVEKLNEIRAKAHESLRANIAASPERKEKLRKAALIRWSRYRALNQ